MDSRNGLPDTPWIDYKSGRAFREGDSVTTITQLISLADMRISARNDVATGLPNRESCDEIISQYINSRLP